MDWVTYIFIQLVILGGIAFIVYLRNKRRQQPQATMIKPKQNVQ